MSTSAAVPDEGETVTARRRWTGRRPRGRPARPAREDESPSARTRHRPSCVTVRRRGSSLPSRVQATPGSDRHRLVVRVDVEVPRGRKSASRARTCTLHGASDLARHETKARARPFGEKAVVPRRPAAFGNVTERGLAALRRESGGCRRTPGSCRPRAGTRHGQPAPVGRPARAAPPAGKSLSRRSEPAQRRHEVDAASRPGHRTAGEGDLVPSGDQAGQ